MNKAGQVADEQNYRVNLIDTDKVMEYMKRKILVISEIHQEFILYQEFVKTLHDTDQMIMKIRSREN